MNGTDVNFLTHDQMEVVSVLNILSSTLSALGSGSIIVSAIYHRRVCSSEVFPIFHLSIADMLASVMFLTNTILFLENTPSIPGSNTPCDFITAIFTSFYLSTFFLTMSYALEAFLRLRMRLSTTTFGNPRFTSCGPSHPIVHVLYVLSWLIPILLMVTLLVMIHNRYSSPSEFPFVVPLQCSLCLPVFHYHENICWENMGSEMRLSYRLIFLVPLVVVFIINIVVYAGIVRVFRQVSMRRGLLSYHQRQDENTIKRRAVLYQTAFLCCWLPSLVLGCISFTSIFHMQQFFWLYVMQAILAPLQGFLNCIIYGWRRESFRKALSEKTRLISTNQPSGVSMTL